jgi:hypothetical protein
VGTLLGDMFVEPVDMVEEVEVPRVKSRGAGGLFLSKSLDMIRLMPAGLVPSVSTTFRPVS